MDCMNIQNFDSYMSFEIRNTILNKDFNFKGTLEFYNQDLFVLLNILSDLKITPKETKR